MRVQQLINVDEGEVELQTAELADPGPGEILVRSRVSGISPGTERAWCLGLPNTPHEWPRPTGYSLIGEVVATGSDVSLAVGQRVFLPVGHASGALVAARRATPIPDDVRDEHAALLAMMGVALQGVRKARIELGEDALVIGGGLIGQLAAQFAHIAGAGRVLLADISDARLNVASACGLAEPVNPQTGTGKTAIAALGQRGQGPEVVIEATGAPEPINDAVKWAAPRGRVVLLGSTRGDTEKVNFYRDVHKKGLTLIGAHAAVRPAEDDAPGYWTVRHDYQVALRLLASKRLRVDPLITHRFDSTDYQRAYGLLFDWDEGLIGAVLHWPKG